MDENINYNHALEAVDTSVRLQDVSTLFNTLRKFPVLQLRASRQLMEHIATSMLNEASEKSRIVRTTVDAIGCIVFPTGILTAECKLCATNLFYGIRDLDDRFLHILLKRMVVSKRDCRGCGLFVHVALSETLCQLGKLPERFKNHFRIDDIEQFETEIHSWNEALDLLRREDVLKVSERSPAIKKRASSALQNEEVRRLRLGTEKNNRIQKKRKGTATTPFGTSPSILESPNEVHWILKLVTMYAASPEFVAEKIHARGLKSYCSAKVHSVCDSMVSSTRHCFTADELQGINYIGKTEFDPSSDGTLMKLKESSNDIAIPSKKTPDSENINENRGSVMTNSVYKVWMPLALGRESFANVMQHGRGSIGDILDLWTSAEGRFVSSVDQIVIAGLAHERMLEDLIGHCLSGACSASPSRKVNHTSDSPDSSALSIMREYFRMLDHASERGIGYEKSFWEHVAKVFAVLESVIVSFLLHGMGEICSVDVNRVITYSRNIKERLQDRVQYHQTEPKGNAAVLIVCDCLSVKMKWEDRRKFRSSIWRACRCMLPNTMFLPVPKPDLWFSWVTCKNDLSTNSRNSVQEANKSTSTARWLYQNPAWRNKQYNYSNFEILHGIVRSLLQGDSGEVTLEVEDILTHLFEDRDVRKCLFSELTKCSNAICSKLDTPSSKNALEAKLRIVRTGIEKIWSLVGHQSELSLFLLNSVVSSEELRCMEKLLVAIAPCSRNIHDCVRDAPTLCEYIAAMYWHLVAQGNTNGNNWMRVKVIAGLMRSQLCRAGLFTDRDTQKWDTALESVMHCFE